MQGRRKIFLLSIAFFYAGQLRAQETDTALYAKDSVVEISTQATIDFFQNGEKSANPSKTFLVTAAKKTISLQNLLKQLANPDHVLADMDRDQKKELLVLNFTGGPPWKDEIWIYKNTGPNRYQYTGKLVAGQTVITEENSFVYRFTDSFDGFFSCTGCNYTDTSDEAPIALREVIINYSKGKLTPLKGDQELRSIINDNLGKLGEGVEPLGSNGEDNGTRKEMAINLAVYYYSFGKNLASVKSLFTKSYKAPDANKVWVAFTKRLQKIISQTSF